MKKKRTLLKKITSQVLCAVMAISSFATSLPASAASSSSVSYTASLDGESVSYTFTSKNGLPSDGTMTLTKLDDVETSSVMLGLGLSATDDSYVISAVNAKFKESEGSEATAAGSGTTLRISADEAENDGSNVSVYALPDTYTSDDIVNLSSYKLSGAEGKDDNGNSCYQWSVSGKQNFVVVIKKLVKISATSNDVTFTISMEADGVTAASDTDALSADYDETLANNYLTLLRKNDSSGKKSSVLFAGKVSSLTESLSKLTISGTKLANVLESGDTATVYELSDSDSAAASKMRKLSSSTSSDEISVTRNSNAANGDEAYILVASTTDVTGAEKNSLVLRDGSTTQKETQIGADEYLVVDKYVTEHEGESVNGQSVYTTTIEQAVHSNADVNISAPEKQEIILALDASATMTDKVDSLNSAVRSFLTSIQETNADRISKWNSGYYQGIDGDSVDNHLLTIKAVVKYNNRVTTLVGNGVTPTSSSDVDTLCNLARLSAGYEPDGSLQDMTRTDLALAKCQSYITDPEHTSVILMTDGEPYGRGAEGVFDYDTDTHGILMTYENTNDALRTARSIKDNGSIIYTVYVQTGYPEGILDAAKASRNIRDLATTADAAGSQSRADSTLGCAFLSLVSSDYPKNGTMHGTADPNEAGDYIFDGTYDDPGTGTFGKYFKMPDEAGGIVNDFVDVAKDIDYRTVYNSGYAGKSSYIYDVISYPFNGDSSAGVTVYQVPRICTGVDSSGNKIFTWGSQTDITDSVSAALENGKYVTVKGYDYEENAISDYNKNLAVGDTETYPSKSGDYGYKLVVQFTIYSNRVFGGNGIETNDSTISGFYPSTPSDDAPVTTPWKSSTYNTGKTDYIVLYPIPVVDLNIDYSVVSDNVVIYAPQTAKLQNLVTDANNNIFVVDSSYETIKAAYDNAKTKQDTALAKYRAAAQEYTAAIGTTNESAKRQALESTIEAYNDAKAEFAEAQEEYDSVQNYVPDGDNNAYVDIAYTLKDPDGTVIATMSIPHGTAYTGTNIKWEYVSDTLIKKHGDYTITATLTPVDTTRAESHTGSTAAGTGKATDFTATPYAHVYVLHMTGTDYSVESGEGISLLEDSTVSIKDISSTSWMTGSITTGAWVGLDGSTPKANGDVEPDASGSTKAMGSQPGVSLYILDKTHVTGSSGGFVAKGENGDYIPVSAEIYRQAGNINKDASDAEQITTKKVPLNDNDELYTDSNGNKVSSVVWEHVCDVVTNCDNTDFRDAKKANNTMDGDTQKNVRYLVHIQKNFLPSVVKQTSTPVIRKGSDIDWTLTVSNTDAEKNEERLSSDSFTIDVLPYRSDGRQDPETGEDAGSKFSGTLYYKKVSIDYSSASTALQNLKNGKASIYYTADTSIRTSELNDNEVRKFAWVKASYSISGNIATVTIPSDAKAIKFDTFLNFGDSVVASMTANITNVNEQQVDDYYLNQAYALTKNARTSSNVVKTKVSTAYLSGLVWEDTNGNGIQDQGEPTIKDVRVGLYTTHNPSGPGAALTVDGVSYDTAFNADGNAINTITTGDDGTYKFENLTSGTYFVVAQNIDGKYTITTQHAVSNTNVDSDAEQAMPTIVNSGATTNASANTSRAWIKNITITDTGSRDHMDIGLLLITGSIDVTKNLDEIYFPSTMSDEEKSLYYPTFHFTLTDQTGKKWYKTVQLNERKLTASCTFTDLPLGTYTLEEESVLNYSLDSIVSSDSITKDVANRKITFTISATKQDFSVTFNNKMTGKSPAGDQNQVINHVPMHLPVKLEINYTGPSTISSQTLTSYTFAASQVKGTVTYDDGSTQEVVLGQTAGYTLDPTTVTNMQNTNKNNRLTIHGYYTEKGRTLEDSFSVAVDLKPPHKFKVVYHANGSTFSNGSTTNTIYYVYDQTNDRFYSYNGTFENPNGLGSDFTFKGWSTSDNGAAGTMYDTEAALKSVAVNEGVSQVDLYARWLTHYDFNGNGGSVNPSRIEAYVGDYIPASPSVSASRSGYNFEGWFTSSNLASGQWLAEISQAERRITGPRTFYAVWSKSTYYRVGYVEEFTAIRSGTYRIRAYGAAGGGDLNNDYGQERENEGGKGGYATGTIYLNAGEKLYVCVGAHGNTPCTYSDDRDWASKKGYIDTNGGGYNGGAGVGGDGQSGCGGGATSVTTTNRGVLSNFSSHTGEVLIVAGGGGGGSYDRGGGSGGSGGGYSFGQGQYGNSGGGGGGGWSGGTSGYDNNHGSNGGTSYISSSMSNAAQSAGDGAGYHSDGWCVIERIGN